MQRDYLIYINNDNNIRQYDTHNGFKEKTVYYIFILFLQRLSICHIICNFSDGPTYLLGTYGIQYLKFG